MKRLAQFSLVLLVLCAFAVPSAVAGNKGDKTKKMSIDLPSDTMVNGTLLKAGNYKLKLDEQTGQLSIRKENGKVVATAMTHMEPRADKAPATELKTIANGAVAELVGVTFHGWQQDAILNNGGAAVGGEDREDR